MTTKITMDVQLADDDLEAFLHWMRAFDRSHTGCHFSIASVGDSNVTSDEIVAMLERVGIPVRYVGKIQ